MIVSKYVSPVVFCKDSYSPVIVEWIIPSPFFQSKMEKDSRSPFIFIFIYLLLMNPINLPAALSFDGPGAEEILPSVF